MNVPLPGTYTFYVISYNDFGPSLNSNVVEITIVDPSSMDMFGQLNQLKSNQFISALPPAPILSYSLRDDSPTKIKLEWFVTTPVAEAASINSTLFLILIHYIILTNNYRNLQNFFFSSCGC